MKFCQPARRPYPRHRIPQPLPPVGYALRFLGEAGANEGAGLRLATAAEGRAPGRDRLGLRDQVEREVEAVPEAVNVEESAGHLLFIVRAVTANVSSVPFVLLSSKP